MEEREMDETWAGVQDELRAAFPSAEFPEEEIAERLRGSLVAMRASEPMTLVSGAIGARGTVVVGGLNGTREVVDFRAGEGRSRKMFYVAAAVAASLVLFVGGVEYGRHLGTAAVVAQAQSAEAFPLGLSLPLEIQGTGSRFVASLARFSDTKSMSEEERRMAREVSLAVLYAASLQLIKEGGEQEVLRSVANMVAESRASERVPGAALPPSF